MKEQRKGAMGGLRRLGTVMSRRKDTKAEERTPSPEKRSRTSRNPLRRGPSSRNMQQIPSPDASTTELPTSPARQQTPIERRMSQSQASQRSQPSTEQRPSELDEYGNIIESAPMNGSVLTNGTQASQGMAAEQRLRPPSTILEEVRRTLALS